MIKQKTLLLFFLLLFGIIAAKLFSIQIINKTNLSDDNYLNTRKIVPERGKIFDRSGLPLAVNKTSYLLFGEPKKIKNRDEIIEKLESTLHIGVATLESKLDTSKNWVPIKSAINNEQKQTILKLGLEGVGFEDQFTRYYPEASLAAHLIGFVGKNRDGENTGYFGIEGFYDKDLTGLPGVLKSERDILGNPILIGTQQKLDAENGRDIYLTIDKSVQEIIKRKLKQGLETYKAKEGCVIIADPMSLEILALSCLPDFDVEQYFLFSERYFKNPAISNLYEPGSTFKPFIMAAAIEEKEVKADDFYLEEGPITIGEFTIRTWNNKYEGRISMTRILEKSSNVGMVYVGQRLGEENLYSYLKRFGFGDVTDIDLQGEVSGSLREKGNLYPIDFATVTFGQGIAVTPIQMIRAFASLINGGEVLRPRTVSKIVTRGIEKTTNRVVKNRVINSRTSEVIKKMLVSTVENGEIKWAKPKDYQIGGKTGTAQIPIKGHYDTAKTIASFVGFAPVDLPKFIALVILQEPETSPWGSETAAPLFFEIAKELFVYYNITPE